MISRKALLISTSLPSQQCEVPAELEAARQFLLSTSGGAWHEEEICCFYASSVFALEEKIKEMAADYTITWFFGKGFPDQHGHHFLVLQDQDFLQDIDLLNTSSKQLLLIDDEGGSANIMITSEMASISDLRKARAMYDRWIDNCENGQVIMHATESNTLQRPKHLAGLFTRKLLQVASTISPSNNRFQLKSIITVGHETPDLLMEEGFVEGPVITWSQGNVKLPFALALPMPAALLPVLKSDQMNGGWQL
jgi:hypothetical protein